jgi:hypothetical protein
MVGAVVHAALGTCCRTSHHGCADRYSRGQRPALEASGLRRTRACMSTL